MVKVGLIGAGFMGTMHSECYANIPNAQVVAVADVRKDKAKELAKKHGARAYVSPNTVLRQAVDMVDICLPTYLHGRFVRRAARAGKHVVCEKPLSLKPREARGAVAAVREAGVKFMCAHVIRFWPEYQLLKQMKDEGTLGRLLSLNLTRMSPTPTWTWQNWIVQGPLSGGALADLHVHDTDFVRYLCGEPRAVDSVGTWNAERGWDHIFTNYHYPDMAVTAQGGWNLPSGYGFYMAYHAVFERGSLTFDMRLDPPVTLCTDDGQVTHPEAPKPDVGAAAGGGNISDLGGYYIELKYFVDCIERGEEPSVVTGEDSVKTVELLAKEIKSAQKKSKG